MDTRARSEHASEDSGTASSRRKSDAPAESVRVLKPRRAAPADAVRPTRAEVAESPNSASMGSGVEAADSPPVVLARAALLFDTARLADDITVRLRRQVR